MQPRRPGSVTTAGIMAILYGSLSVLCGMCGVVNLIAQTALGDNFVPGNDPLQVQVQQELRAALERDVPGYEAYQIASTLLGLTLALVILWAGIGILNVRHGARSLALTGCLAAIAATLAQAAFQAIYVMPAVSQAFQVALPAAIPQAGGPQGAQALEIIEVMMTLFAVVMVIVYVVVAIYLGIIIMLLCGRRARAAFVAADGFAPEDGAGFEERAVGEESRFRGYEDHDDEERPRRGGRADDRPKE